MNYNFVIKKIIENKNSDKIIFQDKNKKITWKELFLISSFNSKIIKKKKDTNIVIIVNRKISTLIAIISVILAGKTFCPISNLTPSKRLQKILKKLNTTSIIQNDSNTIGISNKIKKIRIKFKIDKNVNYSFSLKNINQICYILFTSGSTGEPKGVMLSYKNLKNTITWSKKYLRWDKNDKIGVATSFSFDISMFDIFSSIYFNVPLFIISNPQNPIITSKEIIKNKVSSIFSVPSFFSNFVYYDLIQKKNLKLKRIISGGDFLSAKIVEIWKKFQKKTIIYNVWGPTETSIVNTMHKIKNNELNIIKRSMQIPVGKSTKKMEIKLFRKKKFYTTPNTKGEICVFGDSVSRGYIGETHTNKKYILYNNKRGFLTGDIGFFDINKNLYIIGRNDSTVKISGYRIDLRDIEKNANKIKDVMEAKAIVIENDRKYISLFIQTRNSDLKNSFKKKLSEYLPIYSLPKKIFFIKKFPKTLNGKIDLKRLRKKSNDL